MIVVGLTGSIGMGKSTTMRMFADEGVPVIDSDAIVHSLYEGRAAPLVEAAFPGSTRNGRVDRQALSQMVVGDPQALSRLERIVHPLVREEERALIDAARADGAPIVVVDVPLLFETGRDVEVDRIVVVSCAPELQRRRVLARPGMTEAKLEAILARQSPDSRKRERADFVIWTDGGMESARRQVRKVLSRLRRSSNPETH